MARCATQRPGSVQYPPAVPTEHDRKRSQDWAGASEGGIHSKEPRVDEGGDESTHDAGFLSAPLTSPRAAQELELMIASKEKAEIRTSLAPRCHPLPLTCCPSRGTEFFWVSVLDRSVLATKNCEQRLGVGCCHIIQKFDALTCANMKLCTCRCMHICQPRTTSFDLRIPARHDRIAARCTATVCRL